jgi:hypothetical protein
MAQPSSLDKLVLDGLMSRDEPQIAAALEQAGALGWDLPRAQRALTQFLNGLIEEGGYLEEWPDLDSPSVPGPRLECESGTIPLVSVSQRLPVVAGYLPWLPGHRAQLSLYQTTEPFHNLTEEELEEIQKRGPEWRLSKQTHDWGKAATALVQADGWLHEPRDLTFDDYFEEYPHLGEALKVQAADAGVFLIGTQVEFEGNHNDAEFAVLMARLTDAPPKKARRQQP